MTLNVIWQPLSFEDQPKITITLAFLAMYLLLNLMNLAAVFQYLEHLDDFQTIGYVAIIVFKMRPKMFTGKTFAGQDFSMALLTSLSPMTNNKGDTRSF